MPKVLISKLTRYLQTSMNLHKDLVGVCEAFIEQQDLLNHIRWAQSLASFVLLAYHGIGLDEWCGQAPPGWENVHLCWWNHGIDHYWMCPTNTECHEMLAAVYWTPMFIILASEVGASLMEQFMSSWLSHIVSFSAKHFYMDNKRH